MFDEARLNHLSSAYFDQQLTPAKKGELEAMLLGSSRAREIFLEHSEWHGLAREWALRNTPLGETIETPAPSAPKPARPRMVYWLATGAAACLLLALAFTQYRPAKPQTVRTTPESPQQQRLAPRPAPRPARATNATDVAMLGVTTDVMWSGDTLPLSAGSPLTKGWLHLQKGTIRLDFYSGATVAVEGPASVQLISSNLMRLEKGKLTANVPPPAEGFTVLSADLKVVDLGTEFGMNAGEQGDCDIHVFKGEVEIQGNGPDLSGKRLLQGNAVSIRRGKVIPLGADRSAFTNLGDMHKADVMDAEARWKTWKQSSDSFRSMPGLLVYFEFENRENGSSLIPNRAYAAPPNSSGAVVGCESLSGRWPWKSAIGFTKTSDRVRFRTSGETTSLTLMAWVRVDSLLSEHSSLLSMSPEDVGEIHWKIGKSGRLLLGMRASPELRYDSWERLESPVVVTERDFGRWMHFATVIDGDEGTMKHFVNGEEVAASRIIRPTPIRLGLANLGNFDARPGERVRYGAGRSFNGRIDEFALLTRSLSAGEITKSMAGTR